MTKAALIERIRSYDIHLVERIRSYDIQCNTISNLKRENERLQQEVIDQQQNGSIRLLADAVSHLARKVR